MAEKGVGTDSQEGADAEAAARGGRPRNPSLDDAIIQRLGDGWSSTGTRE